MAGPRKNKTARLPNRLRHGTRQCCGSDGRVALRRGIAVVLDQAGPLHRLTLHVGAGTFKLSEGEVASHTMHAERCVVTRQALLDMAQQTDPCGDRDDHPEDHGKPVLRAFRLRGMARCPASAQPVWRIGEEGCRAGGQTKMP